jgi:hypothetical protein
MIYRSTSIRVSRAWLIVAIIAVVIIGIVGANRWKKWHSNDVPRIAVPTR